VAKERQRYRLAISVYIARVFTVGMHSRAGMLGSGVSSNNFKKFFLSGNDKVQTKKRKMCVTAVYLITHKKTEQICLVFGALRAHPHSLVTPIRLAA